MPEAPEALKEHAHKYHGGSWKEYTLAELGHWVHLFVKRAVHRSDSEKKKKDLHDARNYWRMMGAHLDAAETDI
jgi:hypothetical protein